jgi:anti-anti-sigma regulatory factor
LIIHHDVSHRPFHLTIPRPALLTVTVENFGEITILHCLGRIVRGDQTAICVSAVQQEGKSLVVDLTQVEVVDAAGIGALVALQAAGVYLKLMNPTQQVTTAAQSDLFA